VQSVYSLSANPREEKASTTTTSPNHPAETSALTVDALTWPALGKANRAPSTPLSINAPVFFPHHDLNAEAIEFDPFGFPKQCLSPTEAPNTQLWRDTLIEDGLIDPTLKVQTNNLHIHTTDEHNNLLHEQYYTPTIPMPCFYSPSSYYSEHSWSPQTATSNDPMFEFPTTPFYDYPSPTSCEYSSFNEDYQHTQAINDENLQSTRPCADSDTSYASPTNDLGRGDPANKMSLDLKNIVNQNIRGWNSSRKIEAVIELMIRKNISAMTVQETWEAENYVKLIRGHLVLHHNISLSRWKETTKKQQGGVRKGVAIILSPEFAEAYKRANSPEPITPDDDSPFVGRFIGVSLCFPSTNHKGRCIKHKQRNYSYPQSIILGKKINMKILTS
jgi:hypothetical protein